MYDHLKLYFDKIAVTNFEQINLLFGITLNDKKSEHLFNFLVILAHRVIWQVRNKIKKLNKVVNIKDYFDSILRTSLWKLHMGIDRKSFLRTFGGRNGLVNFDQYDRFDLVRM
jgi:hypothetical protein